MHVLDSLEINGGSSMCFQMFNSMKDDFGLDVECLVVSKTGEYGRKDIIATDIARRLSIKSISYEKFKEISEQYKDYVIIHHRLECTRPLSFSFGQKLYLVVNHTVQDLKRILKFKNADIIVAVCEYIKKISPKIKIPYEVILNGISENNSSPDHKAGFVSGRCHRLPPCKFSLSSLSFLDSLKIPNHTHYLIGPGARDIGNYTKKHPSTCVKYIGKLDDYNKKSELIKSFDLYFYDTYLHEGASVAILEGLSAGVPVICKPLGGNKELVKDGINGFYYREFSQAKSIITSLVEDANKLQKLKESTVEDFRKRLDIKICVAKYLKVIEKYAR